MSGHDNGTSSINFLRTGCTTSMSIGSKHFVKRRSLSGGRDRELACRW